MASPRRLERGARVGGKYRLVRRLAFGGMGEVWVARNLATGADVAVKRCRDDVASEEASQRFRHEARLGAMLSHRSIVRVFDFVESSDAPPLLVMELLRGETLERRLAGRGPLPGLEALAIAIPVLSALAHAHDSGVLHRDVTPANVFLAVDPDGYVTPKLVDFGVAKLPAAGVQTLDSRVLGTPRYMAPERVRAQGDLDGRSDLFSVAVVLYEMLTGSCPFAASSPSASLAAVLESVVDPDPRIEPRVWLELQRALAKRPYERHASARELGDALLAASGQTAASLAECLRKAVPADSGGAVESIPLGQSLSNASGQSLRRTGGLLMRRGARAARWVAVAALVTVTGLAFLQRRSPPETIASATSPAVPSQAPQPSSTPEAMPSPAPPPPAVPPPSAPAVVPHRSHPNRPRPVATTPGF